jgi:DNA-binding PadR family transcriptional regulator
MPSNSYQIYKSVAEKTRGRWKPNVDSIQVTLGQLAEAGLIREISKSHGSRHLKKCYQITPNGVKFLKQGKDVLANSDRIWFALRGIFIELMDATLLPTFLGEASKDNFQMTREIIEAKMPKLITEKAKLSLKNYALNLVMQLKWTKEKMRELRRREDLL